MPKPWRLTHLTTVEIEVLDRVAQGKSNAAIAGELGKSFYTVKNHVERILDKLGACSRTEAVAIYLRPKGFR